MICSVVAAIYLTYVQLIVPAQEQTYICYLQVEEGNNRYFEQNKTAKKIGKT